MRSPDVSPPRSLARALTPGFSLAFRAGLTLGLSLVLGACGGGEGSGTGRQLEADAARSEAWRAQKERASIADPAAAGIGRRAPDLPFETLDGEAYTLSSYAGGAPLLLIVRDVDCPVSQRIGPRTARVDARARELGVRVLYVNPCPHNGREAILGEIETYGFASPYVHDEATAFLHALDIRISTEFLLFDEALTLQYRGAIDDQIGRGVNNIREPRYRFLDDALDAVVAGATPGIPASKAPGCVLAREPEGAELLVQVEEQHGGPTYHREVARILQRRCLECHRDGGVAPSTLNFESYDQVRGRREMIRLVVEDDVMPPWFAAPDTGPWRNDRSLTPDEEATLLAWIDAGAPEGDPAEAPRPRIFASGWGIGEPDVVIPLAEPFRVPSDGVVDLQYLAGEHVVEDDLWVTALQILPTAPKVVHHVVVLIQEPPEAAGTAKLVREALAPWQKRRGGWEFLGGYLPGKGPRVYPEGAARFVPKGSRIQFVMHYTACGVETLDRTRIGFVTTDEVPDMVAQAYVMKNEELAIPPGAQDLAFEDEWIVPKDIRLVTLTPHMHMRGSAFAVYVQPPGLPEERVLELPRWDDAWQFSYAFEEPRDLPAGTRFRVVGVYDNSALNPNLAPGDWQETVVNGPQVWDEMLMLAVEWIAPKETIRRLK